MERISFFNKDACIFFLLALIFNFIFWSLSYKTKYFTGILHPQGEIAYNIYKYNIPMLNKDRLAEIVNRDNIQEKRVDFADIDHKKFGKPKSHISVTNTIGYGVLLGLLWKITGSLQYRDIEILQILIFSFLFFLFYQIALMLFNSRIFAVSSCMALLLFFPIFHQNVQALRDIWMFYGGVFLLYGIVAYFKSKIGIALLILFCLLFSICQFMRPAAFVTVLSLTLGLLFIGFLHDCHFRKIIMCLMCLWLSNLVVFWIPFVSYNRFVYGKSVVGPTGQNFLEGLGQYSNQWGYQLSDTWFYTFMKERHGLTSGTPECDEKAKELFFRAIKENPSFFLKTIFYRIPYLLFPFLPWIGSLWNVVVIREGLINKIKFVFTSPAAFIDFMIHYLYVIFFLLVGYMGAFFLIFKKKYVAVILISCVIISSWPVVFSHVEPRYLVPYYAFFSFFVGYFVVYCLEHFGLIKSTQKVWV